MKYDKNVILAAVVALIAILVLPMEAIAGDGSGTSTVSGEISIDYSLDAPTTIGLGTLKPSNTTSSAAQTIRGYTNDMTMNNLRFSVSAANSGKLKKDNTSLSSALRLTRAGYNLTLNGNPQYITSLWAMVSGYGVKEMSTNDIVIYQPPFTPVASGAYSTTVTFTATFS